MPSEMLLRVRDLVAQYEAGETPAVDGVSFELAPGDAVGLLGESGCGKTTTALALVRMLPPAARVVRGSIQFRGRELLALPEPELEKIRGLEIGLIFQEPAMALNPVLRVGDQVAEVLRAHRPWSRRACRAEAESLLAEVRLDDVSRIYAAYPHQLSGGQRQRIAIAQAVACRPSLLIADEPTAALDARVQAELLGLLKDLQQRRHMALLLISHNPGVLARVADRLLVMQAGRIVEQGPLRELRRHPQRPYTRALLDPLPSRKDRCAR